MINSSIAVLFALLVLIPTPQQTAGVADQLAPTVHPALPATTSELWLVPADDEVTGRTRERYQSLAEGVGYYGTGDYARALAIVSGVILPADPIADYAAYYTGLSQLRVGRAADARAMFASIRDRKPQGYLSIAAAVGEAEAAEAVGDLKAAVAMYQKLADSRATVSDEILSKLGRSALASGDKKTAAEAFVRVYYEYALSDSALEAGAQLELLRDQIVKTGYKADLGRATMLYGARRYPEARTAFADLRSQVSGDDRELTDLRIAECDFFLRRHPAARDGLAPYLDRAARKAEARFFYLSALREMGQHDEYVHQTHQLVADFPDSSWSEEALNNLGTHHILQNEDELAAQAFRELYEKFAAGPRAERAAWKYGWWKYKNAEYAETIRVFEDAAARFARSDYRPSFLYWAARSHAKLGEGVQADARLRLVFTDYGNSYYGRLADKQLARRSAAVAATGGVVPASMQAPAAAESKSIPTERLIRRLLAAGLYDDALNELRYAQRVWGTSPAIDATIAWAYHQKGDLRRAITLMRRAYPQHLTSGQELPIEILQVIFPLTYWDSIRRYSAARDLDPYLVAALIAQESTFDPKIRSAANAWGLMQLVPATGRRLARSVGMKRFTTPMLTDAETNIRLGTLYFSRLVEQFGGTYYALASYNAGESRVVRWKAERPGLDEDEFIDDIPFPETQNYVKRILGTAEDYRMLYGKGAARSIPVSQLTSSSGSEPPAAQSAAPKKPGTKKAPAKKPSSSSKKRRR